MHELSLVEAMFDEADAAIAPHAPAEVRRVTLRVGALAGVEVTLLRTAFDGCRELRGYVHATLEVIDDPAEWRCQGCGEARSHAAPAWCASCGAPLRLVRGDALVLERLELEVRDV